MRKEKKCICLYCELCIGSYISNDGLCAIHGINVAAVIRCHDVCVVYYLIDYTIINMLLCYFLNCNCIDTIIDITTHLT